MNTPLGFTRNVIKPNYALITPDGFVPSNMPGWTGVVFNVLISGALGAKFNQHLVTFAKDGRGTGNSGAKQLFAYVVSGKVALNNEKLEAGGYAWLPPGTAYTFTSNDARVLLIEKMYEPLAGTPTPAAMFGNESKIAGQPFLGDPDAILQTLLPDNLSFDMAMNVFTYKPGATLPFVETHVMEHGMMILSGQGVYRLDNDWHPVIEGDMIWIGPYCPQWFVCSGKKPARYIYYKDVNRAA
ncbi:MAG: (S)-ureidoglycine aminohydrolase [Verrucomicrobiae bacterium]|nr:(S)-ureidoglycine aminohydrolase [Verrucomicrobiae bacterium]